MRYLPTVDLWNPALHTAVVSGQLKLQPGQWVRCGQRRPSRFVAVRPRGTIWAVHPDGSGGVANVRFKQLLTTHIASKVGVAS